METPSVILPQEEQVTDQVNNEEDSMDVKDKKNNSNKLLILLDINGALCHRMAKKQLINRTRDCKYKAYNVYKRPGLDDLLQFFDTHRDTYDVYLYTSIMAHNAAAMVLKLMPDHAEYYTERIFGRDMNKLIPVYMPDEEKKKKHERRVDTVRDLAKVWEVVPQYGPHNTVLVDDDEVKCAEYASNSIVVPEFVDEVQLTFMEDDQTLGKLTRYLQALARRKEDGDQVARDVRKYMKMYPFVDALSSSSPVGSEDKEDCGSEGDVVEGDTKLIDTKPIDSEIINKPSIDNNDNSDNDSESTLITMMQKSFNLQDDEKDDV